MYLNNFAKIEVTLADVTPLRLYEFLTYINLFFQFSEENPPLEEQVYVFSKRLKMQPSEMMRLKTAHRIKMFKYEIDLIKKENSKQS